MAKTVDYKSLQAELETILDTLQRDDTGVDEAMKYYQRGLEIVAQLQKYLQDTENSVKELQAKFKS